MWTRLSEPNDKLSDDRLEEPSKAIRQRVEAARKIQQARFQGKGLTCNADMGVAEVREFCGVDGAGRGLLRAAMTQLGMSARSYHRILKLSRTIADLEGARDLATHHLAEAIQDLPRRHIEGFVRSSARKAMAHRRSRIPTRRDAQAARQVLRLRNPVA